MSVVKHGIIIRMTNIYIANVGNENEETSQSFSGLILIYQNDKNLEPCCISQGINQNYFNFSI
jgi:hypothetical protein